MPHAPQSKKDRQKFSLSDVGGKNIPTNIEAEKAVLAAILLNDENLTLVSDILKPHHFYSYAHQVIYQAIIELAQENKRIDLLVLQDLLATKNNLEAVGGIPYLMELQENIPALGLIAQHAAIVKDKSTLRELISTASEIIQHCYEQKVDEIDEVLDFAEKKVFQISNNLTIPTFVKLDAVLKKTFQQLAEVKTCREGVTGVPSGFTHFDMMTSGMQRGDLLILAARPSMGKTALALNMALSAWNSGAPVAIFSLEMSAEQLVLRMLSTQSGIAHQKIRNAMVSSEEWMTLTNTAAKLAEAGIFIDDTATINIMELRAKARKLKAQENIGLIIIDYLQLIGSHQRFENRTQEISAISRGLKALAKELDVPVLACSQLSRSLETRMDKRPMLSDLRESGAIEQDGDVIFFIYRDVVYNPDTEHPDLTEIIIGKQRNGPVGSFYANFKGDIAQFVDIADEQALI
ncbi:MAG: replicative DNA helicase [Epsilonproteobacteria bacterium]|nr:replicative DNA helicase [Campylobacterota bacterium]